MFVFSHSFFNEIFRHSLRYGRRGSRCTWLCRLRLVCCSVYPCLTENNSVMICLYAMRILKGYRMCDMVSEMPICTVYSLCRRRTYAFVCFRSCSRTVGRFVEETRPFSCRHTFLSEKLSVATRLTVHPTKPRSPLPTIVFFSGLPLPGWSDYSIRMLPRGSSNLLEIYF